MRSLRVGLGVLLLICIGSGCAVYQPQSFWEVTKTEVDLEANNFKVRKLGAQGNATARFLFGIPTGWGGVVGIPLDKMDLQARSMQQLHENWDGKGAVFLHNINVEWTDYGIPGIFVFHQNTITADIYEFDGPYVDYGTRQ